MNEKKIEQDFKEMCSNLETAAETCAWLYKEQQRLFEIVKGQDKRIAKLERKSIRESKPAKMN